MADQKDPLVSAFFMIDFGNVKGAFRECTGMGSENEIVEYKASGTQGKMILKKVPGRMKWNNIVLKRGITDAMDLWDWRGQVEQGKAVARWDFVDVWPSKITGPTYNATNNEIGIEEMELVHTGYKRVKA